MKNDILVLVYPGLEKYDKGTVRCSQAYVTNGSGACVDWLMDCKRCENCPMKDFTLRSDNPDEYRTLYPHSPFETEMGKDTKDFICNYSEKQ